MAEVSSTAVLEEGNKFAEGKFAPAVATVEVGKFDMILNLPEYKMSLLGLEIDVTDESGLVVASISDGAIQRHNELYPTQALRIYDKIVKADDTVEPSQMYKKMKTSAREQKESLRVYVSRPSRFEVMVSNKGELGLKLNYKNNSAGINITSISDGGMLAKWNKAHLDRQALPGDRIIAVNGKEMRGLELIESIKEEQASSTLQDIRMTVLRYEK